MKRILILGALALLWSCATQAPLSERPETVADFPMTWTDAGQNWWNKQVFYEIFVRAYQDSDGDGKGDLKGLISRLDYIKDLGVTALWLMPIFEAHSGHGYDTLDYWQVDKDYGTNEDFKTLIKEAHTRGIKIILDLVLNHTSDRHPWFKSQVEAPQGPNKDYYFIKDTPFSRYSRVVSGSTKPLYFYGLFDATMPDLNYTNPKVSEEMLKVTEFWLKEMGADGYRLDAIKYLIEEGSQSENTPQTHQWLKEKFFKTVKKANPGAFTIGEVWDDADTVLSYTGDQMDICFHFPLSSAIASSIADQSADDIHGTLKRTLSTFPVNQWGTFLRNHDQKRLMKEWSGDEAKVRAAVGLLLTLPGVPFLYYGEEIGLSENRKAMQWSEGAKNWGFSTASNVYNNGTQENVPLRSVSAQDGKSGSLLTYYKDLIKLRTSKTALQTGATVLVDTGNNQVLSYLRWDGAKGILVVVNLSSVSQSSYGLCLWKGPFKEDLNPLSLWPVGATLKKTPVIDGGFAGWKPLDTLSPWAVLVMEL